MPWSAKGTYMAFQQAALLFLLAQGSSRFPHTQAGDRQLVTLWLRDGTGDRLRPTVPLLENFCSKSTFHILIPGQQQTVKCMALNRAGEITGKYVNLINVHNFIV